MTRLYQIGIAFLLLLLCYGLARGQGSFNMTGRLDFAGFRAGDPSWMIGKGIMFQPIDPSLTSRFRELEGKKIVISVREAE